MSPAAMPMMTLRKPWSLPPRGLALFEGDRETPRLSHYFLPGVIRKGQRILFLDGANSASPHLMARLGRRFCIPFVQFNRSLQIARAFTCFQLTELIARVPQFLADFPAQVLMVTAFPELYLDQDVRDWDARVAFERALRDLREWSALGEPPLAVAVFSSSAGFTPGNSRRNFIGRTRMAATGVWRFDHNEQGKLTLSLQPPFRERHDISMRMMEDGRAPQRMTQGASPGQNTLTRTQTVDQ
jgi:hypothetical protein